MTKRPAASAARQVKVSRKQADEARDQLAAGGLSHQERRKLRSIAAARDEAERRRRGKLRHGVIVAAGAIAAMAVVAAAGGLVTAIRASGGHGTPGTFVVGKACFSSRIGCRWSGTFRSDDGRTVQHVRYDGTLPATAGLGSSVPAVEPAGSHVVYPPHSSHAWITDVLLMLFAGGVVGFFLWISPLGLGARESRGAIV
jgi:hypothetical protein